MIAHASRRWCCPTLAMPMHLRAGWPATAPMPRILCKRHACAHFKDSWLGKNRAPELLLVDDLVAVEQKQAGRNGNGGSATPEAELIAKADATRLEAAVAELPLAFREALVLRDVQGLDYREIADVTRVPVGTVMSRLARARQRLVAAIAADEQ